MTARKPAENKHARHFSKKRTVLADRLSKVTALMCRSQHAAIWIHEGKNEKLIGGYNAPDGIDMGRFKRPSKFDAPILLHVNAKGWGDHPLINGELGDIRSAIFTPLRLDNDVKGTLVVGSEETFDEIPDYVARSLDDWGPLVSQMLNRQIRLSHMLWDAADFLMR